MDTATALLDALASEPAKRHDLLFYSTFAHKTFLLMQRTGPNAEGYAKLQQTFADAVSKVRSLIQEADQQHGFKGAQALTEISHTGMAKLLDLMHDLAVIKQSA
ncbi:MAG TPA: hypothetical protein VFX22_10985 [Candidatus Kapabacteria bacterium]|nr:hypothetical protein [Candidatus Kapabacteria bacterium]